MRLPRRRRRRRQGADLHRRLDHAEERPPGVPRRRPLGGSNALRPVRRGVDAVGLAGGPRRRGAASRCEVLLVGVRPHLDRLPRVDRRRGLQDRVLRARRRPADRGDGRHRQATDHVHRHGDALRDRGGGRRGPPRRRLRHRTARLYQFVSGSGQRRQPAQDPPSRRRPSASSRVCPITRSATRWRRRPRRSARRSSRSTSHSDVRTAASTAPSRSSRRSSPNSSMPCGRHRPPSGRSTTARPRPTAAVGRTDGRCSWPVTWRQVR